MSDKENVDRIRAQLALAMGGRMISPRQSVLLIEALTKGMTVEQILAACRHAGIDSDIVSE